MKRAFDISIRAFILSAVMILVSCCEIDSPIKPIDNTDYSKTRKVLLLYSAGFNSLRDYLLDDINDLKKGWLPDGEDEENILLVYTHTPSRRGSYSIPTNPYLIRLYRDKDSLAVSDTLITYGTRTISSSADQLNSVLQHIKDSYPAKSYGMIFSSHATGFLPAGYYTKPSSYTFIKSGMMSYGHTGIPSPVPYIEPEYDPSLPMVKSIGQDVSGSYSYEIDLRDFAEAIPMKLDYILFDACLMGGVEVAYELKDKCGKAGFSQAEVLAEGLDYKTLTHHLLKGEESNPEAVCEDYHKQYEDRTGPYKSATVSLVDIDNMDKLAATCTSLFDKYRDAIKQLDKSAVQDFGGSKKYFFDLMDIVVRAGASDAEIREMESAVNDVVIYKNMTGQYFSSTDGLIHKIDRFTGLTMYLPGAGTVELDKFYKTLNWNQATGLIE